MQERKVFVNLKDGLDTSAVTYFIHAATNFRAHIRITHGGKSANAKSLLGVIALNIGPQAVIKLVADGEDEAEAINALETFLSEERT